MKTYINADDRTRHIVMLSAQETMRALSVSDSLTEEEQKLLKDSVKKIEKFNRLISTRMGDAYWRKIEKTMRCNKLKLVGNYEPSRDCVSHIAVEDLEKALNDLRMLRCLDCEKCDFTNCGTYASFIACDVQGEMSEGECPFKL